MLNVDLLNRRNVAVPRGINASSPKSRLLNATFHFYVACVESFQLIANSLASLQPIPNLPDTRGLVREFESRVDDLRRSAAGDEDDRASALRFMSATARLGSLADAIHDCRDEANALDWEAWNRNYF